MSAFFPGHTRPGRRAPRWAAGLLLASVAGLATPQQAQLAHDAEVQIRAEIQRRAAALPGTLELTIDTSSLTRFEACDSLSASLPANARLRHRMSVAVRCEAPERWQTYVQVQLALHGPYVVTARSIDQDQRITPDLIEVREGDLLALPPGVILSPDEVLGQVAARRLGVGQLLRHNAVRSPGAVQRGQIVKLRVRGTGFVATGEGEALESAPPGATVQVRTASGQTVAGVVQPDGVVEVGL